MHPSLAAAEFQLDRSRKQQGIDDRKQEREKAVAHCTDLIGTKQANLLARYPFPQPWLLCSSMHQVLHTSRAQLRAISKGCGVLSYLECSRDSHSVMG